MTITAEVTRAARALLGWSQDTLAETAGVARATIAEFEAGTRHPYARTLTTIESALEAAGVIFIPENGEGAGVRLRKRKSVPKTTTTRSKKRRKSKNRAR